MTVELWYGRQPDNPAEQNILVDLNDFLRGQPEHYILLSTFSAGIRSHEIDLLVLKRQAWFVAEIKHVWGKVIGGRNGAWKYTHRDGSLKPLTNPYLQVKGHHDGLRDWLTANLQTIRPATVPDKSINPHNFHPLQYIVLFPRIPDDCEIEIGDHPVQLVDPNKFRLALAMRTMRDVEFTLEELQMIPRLLNLTQWQVDPAASSTVASIVPDDSRIQPIPAEHPLKSKADDNRITKAFPANYQPPTVRMLVPRDQGLSLPAFYITGSPIMIGRDHDCELAINHESVSRKHAEVSWDKDRWIVRDLGSRNGVFVAYNGDPSTERRVDRFNALKNGSIVRFGQVSFTFLLNEGK